MRLICPEYNWEQEIAENKVNVVCIENPAAFTDIVSDMWHQYNGYDGKIIISDGNASVKFSKETEVIINPLAVDYNDKKIITALYQEMKSTADCMLQEETLRIRTELIEYLDKVIGTVPYMSAYDYDLDLTGLLKLFGVRIEHTEGELSELLVEYMKLRKSLCSISYFIFVNLKNYLSEEDLVLLYEAANYEKIHLILLESSQRDIINGERTLIIDKDLCLVNLN